MPNPRRLLVKLTDERILEFILDAECPGCNSSFGDCTCPILDSWTLNELLAAGFLRQVERESVTEQDVFIHRGSRPSLNSQL